MRANTITIAIVAKPILKTIATLTEQFSSVNSTFRKVDDITHPASSALRFCVNARPSYSDR